MIFARKVFPGMPKWMAVLRPNCQISYGTEQLTRPSRATQSHANKLEGRSQIELLVTNINELGSNFFCDLCTEQVNKWVLLVHIVF